MKEELEKIYQGSVKNLYKDQSGALYFEYSDRYSIYDWGEMPDHIMGKGHHLSKMAALFFKSLDHITTHHFQELTKENKCKVQSFFVPQIEDKNYSFYQTKPTDCLIPLEVIFRMGAPKGSSLLKRRKDLKAGDRFTEPLIEFTTKLENCDRHLTEQEAQSISGLNDNEFLELKSITSKIASELQSILKKGEFELWDGKLEFALKGKERTITLVDSIGLDELRVNYKDVSLSKELIRQYYNPTIWFHSLESYKHNHANHWKKQMISDGIIPLPLSNSFKKLIEKMYQAFTADLESILQGSKASAVSQWYTDYKSFEDSKLKILLIGSGGREHTLAWKMKQDPMVEDIFITNNSHPMIAEEKLSFFNYKQESLITDIKQKEINFVVIGPEAPLIQGLADELNANDIITLGPGKEGSQLEASKDFSKKIMAKAKIPTARSAYFEDAQQAKNYLNEHYADKSCVIKADGIAAGKGVIMCKDLNEAICAVDTLMISKTISQQGYGIVIEEELIGRELSAFALIDKNSYLYLGDACDYKRLLDNDQGPNTGGMGTYSPCSWISNKEREEIEKNILSPLIKQLKTQAIQYTGVLFIGLMQTDEGMKVLEFNCRFGDPETQSLLPLLNIDLAQCLYKTAQNRLNEEITCNPISQSCVHVVTAAKGYPGTQGQIVEKGDEISIDLNSDLKHKVFFAGVKAEKDQLLTNGGRVLGISCIANTQEEARNLCYQQLNKIKFKGMQYRHDIAKK